MSEYSDVGSVIHMNNCICHQSFSDIREYVNVVSYYGCKVCDYTSTDVTNMHDHVVESHLQRTSGTEGMVFISDGSVGSNDSSTAVVQMPSSELVQAATNEAACAVETVGLMPKEFSTISQSGCDFLSSTVVTHSADPLSLQPLHSTVASQTLQFFVNNHKVQLNSFNSESVKDFAGTVPDNIEAGLFANDSQGNSFVQPVGSVQAIGTLADQSCIGQSVESGQQITEMYVCESCLGTVFSGIGIVQHMLQVHGIRLDSISVTRSHEEPVTPVGAQTTEIAMPPNTISIGTQAQLAKKPGRKRKVVADVAASGAAEERANKDRDTAAEKDNAAAMAVRTLGIERLTAVGGQSGLSKRRIQPPRALVEDYHIHRLRQTTPRIRSSAVCLAPEIPCTFVGCSATFCQQDAADYHTKCHTKSGPFSCPECHGSFAEWSAMLPHLWTVHSIDLYAYHCSKCNFRADCPSAMTHHAVAKHGASKPTQPFLCSICGQTFRKASLRNQHEKSHNSRRLFTQPRPRSELVAFRRCICDVCKRLFANRKSLNKHVEVKFCV